MRTAKNSAALDSCLVLAIGGNGGSEVHSESYQRNVKPINGQSVSSLGSFIDSPRARMFGKRFAGLAVEAGKKVSPQGTTNGRSHVPVKNHRRRVKG
jgi:hypothetical protein